MLTFCSRVVDLDEGVEMVVVEAVVEGVANAQFAQTTPRCLGRISYLKNTTMSSVWLKAQNGTNSGLLCDENYPTVSASPDQRGMRACLRIYLIYLQYLQASASSTAAAQGSIHTADNVYRVRW